MSSSHSRRAPVRPRWVWGGTAVGLAGLVLLGLAVAIASWWWALAGGVVLALGLLAARHGRILRDVHGTEPSGSAGQVEARQLRDGEVHDGVRAGDMIADRAARRDALATEATRRALVASRAPRGRLGGMEGALLLVAAAVLAGAQMSSLFPNTAIGESHATTVLLPAIVLAWCGLRVVTDADRPHRVTGLVALAVGAFTVLFAALAHHQAAAPMVLEIVCGAVAAVAAVGLVADG